MSMVAGFPWVDKTRRRSCHRRNDESTELGVFEAERYYSTTAESLGSHRGTSLSQKISLPTKEVHGRSSTKNWRDLGRASLDIPMLSQSKEAFLDTINQTKETNNNNNNNKKKKKKQQKPSSPGGKLASFFNSLISQAVSKKKKNNNINKPSKSVKDDVVEDEEESLSGWRRMRRRSSMSHFRSSLTSSRPKRTSMSDVDAKSIESCPTVVAGFRTPPPIINTKGLGRHVAAQETKGFKRFAEEDDEGGESDSSSDLFELKLSFEYDHHHHHRHHLGYCGGDLPVYETTHMDTIKISSRNPIANGRNRDF